MKRLTRRAQVLIFALIIMIFVGIGFYLFMPKETKQANPEYTIEVVKEDQKLVSVYKDAISKEQSSSSYTPCTLTVEKGTKINDYTLSQKQTFTKYMKLEGPDGKEQLKKSKQVITHYAYSLLLTGDIIEKTNKDTNEKTYEIVNARISYDYIPMVLLSNENSVSIMNKEKTKEKVVNLNDFQNALNDVNKRETMLSW